VSPRRQRSPARTVVLYRIQKVYGRERGVEGEEGRGRDKRQKVNGRERGLEGDEGRGMDRKSGWLVFFVAVTAFVTTTTKATLFSPRIGDDLWRSWYLFRPLGPTQPGHPSVGRYIEYLRWSVTQSTTAAAVYGAI